MSLVKEEMKTFIKDKLNIETRKKSTRRVGSKRYILEMETIHDKMEILKNNIYNK